MIVIGVTGGIASGKSTVAKYLNEAKDVPVIDADKLGHKCYAKDTTCFNKVVEAFGDILAPDGSIDRKKLGAIVFGSEAEMKRLTSIVWPEIATMLREELQKLADEGADCVVVEAAVMIESGWNELVDELWVVAVPRDLAISRLMARNSLSEAAAVERINAQMPQEEKLELADTVIWNSADLPRLIKSIDEVWDNFQKGRLASYDDYGDLPAPIAPEEYRT